MNPHFSPREYKALLTISTHSHLMACAFPRFGAVWRRECRPSHFLWSPTRRSFCGGPLPRTRASASTRSLGNDQTSSSKTGQRPGPAGGRGQSSGSDGAGRRPGSYERGEKGVERKEDPEPDGGCGGAQNKADWGGLRPGISDPSFCAFVHRVAFEEVSGHRVLLKSGPGGYRVSLEGQLQTLPKS